MSVARSYPEVIEYIESRVLYSSAVAHSDGREITFYKARNMDCGNFSSCSGYMISVKDDLQLIPPRVIA